MRRVLVTASAVAAFAVGLLSASAAGAKPEYPGALQKAANMSCTPSCTTCHTDPAGGIAGGDKRVRPGGLQLGAVAGLQIKNMFMPPLLEGDFDKDGRTDVVELQAGEDPLSAANTLICAPNYGCFASRVTRGHTGDGAAAVAALAVAALCAYAGRRRGRAR